MASITKKKNKGNIYYYYTECKRIGGKPKLVKEIYLGRAEQVLKKIQESKTNVAKASHFKFGLEAALYQVASELGLELIINSFATDSSPSLDVGQMIVAAAINRVCDPKSKRGIIKWWRQTTLPELFAIPQKNIKSQRFWDAMDRIPTETIPGIEEKIWENLLDLYQIPMDILLYDTTNFYTYMDPTTESEICKTGHNKASKHHLRQVGVAMAVGRGCGIPFFHQVYQGSVHDATLFPTAISTLISRVRKVNKTVEEVTLVYDKGNNSLENSRNIEGKSDIYVVGSLVPSQFPDLLKVRLSRYGTAELKNGKEVRFFETKRKIFEKESRVIITFNEKLKRKQKKTFERNMGKILSRASTVVWSRVKDRKAKLKEIIDGRLPMSLFTFIEGENTPCVADAKAVRRHQKRFGKNIIYTTHPTMESVDVIQCYRDRNNLEQIFAEMNDPEQTSFRPVYHWTDQKITIHAFICILGLLILKVLEHKISLHDPDVCPDEVIELLRELQSLILVDSARRVQKILSLHDKRILNWLSPLGLDEIAGKLAIHIPDG